MKDHMPRVAAINAEVDELMRGIEAQPPQEREKRRARIESLQAELESLLAELQGSNRPH